MKQLCCETWEAVVAEFIESKLKELAAAEQAGTPSFVLKPQYKIIENWKNFCPSCGSQLVADATPAIRPTPVVKKKPVVMKKHPCKGCKGTGIVSGAGTDDPTRCMTCWGRGYLTKENNVRDPEDQQHNEIEERVKKRAEEAESKKIEEAIDDRKSD